MRWDRLFDDLEGQLEQELEAEEIDVVAEEERLRLARLGLRDRLVAMAGLGRAGAEPVRLALRDGITVRLCAHAIGRDWIAGDLVDDGPARRSGIVPFGAIVAVIPTTEQLVASIEADGRAEPTASLSARLGLTFVLRDLCRRRAPVDISAAAARVHGTIDRVARDHVDLAEHDPGEARRNPAVRQVRVVPQAMLDLVRY